MQILEWSEKKPPKSGDWDLKPGDLQTMCQIKPKRRIIFVILFTLSDISYSIHFYMLCNIGSSSCWFSFLLKLSSVSLSMSVGHLTFPQTLANTFFTGRRMELDPVYPPPPLNSIIHSICPLWRQFFWKLLNSHWNCLTISRFSDLSGHLEAKSGDHELIAQTRSLLPCEQRPFDLPR